MSAAARIFMSYDSAFAPADLILMFALRLTGTKSPEEKKRTQADNDQATKYDLVPAHQLRLRSLANS
ncbi:MAG TPA: hypothetical protein QF882_00880, partial [Arenicellales bacterium]|nr:hypothetical protein [Arenicellales bacterium]